MGAGHQRWWLSYESECERYSADVEAIKQKAFDDRMTKRIADSLMRRMETFDMYSPAQISAGLPRIGAADLSFKEPGDGMLGLRATTFKRLATAPLCEGTEPSGHSFVFTSNYGVIEVIADTRVGDRRLLFSRDAVYEVETGSEDNVAKDKNGTMVIGKSFIDQIDRLMGGAGVFSDNQFEARVSALLALEVGARCTDAETSRPCFDHDECRGALRCQRYATQKPVGDDAFSPSNGFTYAGDPASIPPSVGQRDAKPTIAGKVENVQRAIDAGLIPTVGAAKRVFDALWEKSKAPIGESYQIPVVLPVPETDGSLDYFDVAVTSKDVWSIYRHPQCDGFVFDSDATGQSVFIAYERLREMAKLFLLPREKTDRGEALRHRIREAVGAASTLFMGKDSVFDEKRANELVELLARDVELGPGLESMPGIGRALERERNPEPEPLDHLDVDLIAADAKPGED